MNAYGTKRQALNAEACKADRLCSGARFWFLDKIVQKPCTFHGSAAALPWKYALLQWRNSIKTDQKNRFYGIARLPPREETAERFLQQTLY